MWTVRINFTYGVVPFRANTVDKEVRDDVLGASGLLGQTQVSEAVLLDEGSAVTQIASDDGGVREGGGGICLVSDDDDGVLQGVIPWTGEPLHGTRAPSMAIMGGLRELTTDWM